MALESELPLHFNEEELLSFLMRPEHTEPLFATMDAIEVTSPSFTTTSPSISENSTSDFDDMFLSYAPTVDTGISFLPVDFQFGQQAYSVNDVTNVSNLEAGWNPPCVQTPPLNTPHMAKKKRPAPQSSSSDSDDTVSTAASGNPSDYKKQRKRMQNRESAVRSRQRKKQYLETMESQMNALTSQNVALSQENSTLKAENRLLNKQITFLQNLLHNHGVSAPSTDSSLPAPAIAPSSSRPNSFSQPILRAGNVVMLSVVFCAFVFASSSFITPSSSSLPSSASVADGATKTRTGRILLSYKEAEFFQAISSNMSSQLVAFSNAPVLLAILVFVVLIFLLLLWDRTSLLSASLHTPSKHARHERKSSMQRLMGLFTSLTRNTKDE
eukprot:GILJ01000478.1.p1 GENE.GILJ01000478.1~~GILJ01000478.1.p1  ORF type:complete len:384 (-),score=67.33 GILJ01000478.1:44-1195(-)